MPPDDPVVPSIVLPVPVDRDGQHLVYGRFRVLIAAVITEPAATIDALLQVAAT